MTFLSSDRYGSEYRYDLIVGDANTGTIYYFKLNANRNALQLEGELKDRIADNLNELKKVKFATGFGRITDIKLDQMVFCMYFLRKTVPQASTK